MRVNVPINKAVRRGRLTVNLPGALIFLAFSIGVPSLLLQYTEETWILVTGIVVGLIVGFVLGWIYSGFAVLRWQIWAFENVKNVHELKEKAIIEKVIYPDGHWSEKLNFASKEQKQKLKLLERKFVNEDEYHDDLNVAKETSIYISKEQVLVFFGVGILIFGIGVYRYFVKETSNGIQLAAISLIFFGLAYNDYRKKEPQIIISNLGIKLHKKGLMNWEFISGEHIEIERLHNRHQKYLCLDYKENQERILINHLGINVDDFEHLLQVYRLRYEKNNPS